MSAVAFALVVTAAFAHAVWNLHAKKAGAAGALFLWLYVGVASVIYAPLALGVVLLTRPAFGLTEVAFMAGSGAIHTVYLVFLQRGYARGDLSLVYPVARGLGPLLAVMGAIVLLAERPSALTLAGGLVVCVGVIGLGLTRTTQRPVPGAHSGAPTAALGYATATGAAIACYTLWDAYAMSVLVISPILFDWATNLGRWVLLTPYAWPRRSDAWEVWRSHRRAVLTVAVLAPLAYILVLTAYAIAPVAHVAPARELSIVIGTALGLRVLSEGNRRARLASAAAVLAGVAVLGLS